MNKTLIKKLQKQVISLLKKQGNKPLYLLSECLCSEMSRLAGYWLLKKLSKAKIFVLKGVNVKNRKNIAHDILAVDDDGKIFLIDVTIWQFFKNKKSILVNITKDMEQALIYAKEFYKGKWKISEEITKDIYKERSEWEKVLGIETKDVDYRL